MALSIMKKHGINPKVITCDKDNIRSAKTILRNDGVLIQEVVEERTGNLIQIFQIIL